MLTFESTKSEWSVITIEGDALSLINDAGQTRDDVTLPPDIKLAEQIRSAVVKGDKDVYVTVLSALKKHQVMAMTVKDFTE